MNTIRAILHLPAYATVLVMLAAAPIATGADTALQFREETGGYSGIGRIRWKLPTAPDFGCMLMVPHFTQGPRIGCRSRDEFIEISVYARDLRLTPGERREKFITDHQRLLGESLEKSFALQVDRDGPPVVYATLTHKDPANNNRQLALGYYVKGPFAIQFTHEAVQLSPARLARVFSILRSAEPIDALPTLAWKLADYQSVCADLFPAMRPLNERAFAASLFARVDWMRHFRERRSEVSAEQVSEQLRKARSGLAESLKSDTAQSRQQFCGEIPVMAIEAERGLDGGRRRGTIGVQLGNLMANLSGDQGLTPPAGALVGSVDPDSPAQQAGLKAGDIILRLADDAVTSNIDLMGLAALYPAGSTYEVLVLRNGEHLRFSLTSYAAPD